MKFKKQILNILTESFTNQNRDRMKNVLNTFKKSKELREMYLFYESIEKKYFNDTELAKQYVDILSEQLKGKLDFLKDKKYDFINESTSDFEIENELLYEHLDTLCEHDSLKNIDKKLIAKKYLVEYLTTVKPKEEDEEIDITINENLLNTVLTSNFNNYYNMALNEEEKSELISILSLSNDEFITNFTTIKEDIFNKIDKLLTESDGDLKNKLELTKEELNSMKMNKYNYYKLIQLKNGL